MKKFLGICLLIILLTISCSKANGAKTFPFLEKLPPSRMQEIETTGDGWHSFSILRDTETGHDYLLFWTGHGAAITELSK